MPEPTTTVFQPISAAAAAEITRLASLIPAGQSVVVQGGASQAGAGFGAAVRPWSGLTVGGWASRQWGGSGWQYAVQGTLTF